MSKVKFVLNREGVGELLKSKAMEKVLAEYADRVLDRCGDGYGMSVGETSERAKATVGTRSIESNIDNKRNNTLLKALT